MNEYLKIKITIYNYENFIKYSYDNNIELFYIKKDNNTVICIINNKDLDKINKFYHVDIIRRFTKKYYFFLFKKNIINIINLIIGIIAFIYLSNIIVRVDINLENKELLNNLTKELKIN